jgi:hypothetical protein
MPLWSKKERTTIVTLKYDVEADQDGITLSEQGRVAVYFYPWDADSIWFPLSGIKLSLARSTFIMSDNFGKELRINKRSKSQTLEFRRIGRGNVWRLA